MQSVSCRLRVRWWRTVGLSLGAATVLVGTVPAQDWVSKSPRPNVYVREHAMAYDASRDVAVLFGGEEAGFGYWYPFTTPQAVTLEWSGAGWARHLLSQQPSARSQHAMAYDAERERVVMFGGGNGYGPMFADTWEWDGTAWTQLNPTQSPPAMWGHAMAYDAARQRIVLFGGETGSGTPNADTWEWDGTTWTQLAPAQSPPAMWHHAMVYDSVRQRVVLFGGDATVAPSYYYYYYYYAFGYSGGGAYLGETWEWDGTTWTDVSPGIGASPSARGGHGMVYDSERERAVVFGGSTGGGAVNDTWEWDGTRWMPVSTSQSPNARWGHGMAYDAARERVVLYGGEDSPDSAGTSPVPSPGTVNAVLGDKSFDAAFDGRVARFATEKVRLLTHLSYVEELLRKRDVRDWSEPLQRARRQNIEHLNRYRENEVFPRNHDHPERRLPCFIDREGRVCAVGYLVEQTAGRALAEKINARFQYAWLAEMADEELEVWAAKSGLTNRELAMIQPTYGGYGYYPTQTNDTWVYGNTAAATTQVYGSGCVNSPAGAVGILHQPNWQAPPSGSTWIGPAYGNVPPGLYVFTLTFDLTGLDSTTASIGGQVASDNAAQIYLNGAWAGISTPAGSYQLQPFSIGAGFSPGTNTLEFHVQNGSGPSGVLVSGLSGTAMMGSVSVAIPGLFDTGVDTLGAELGPGAQDPHYALSGPAVVAEGSSLRAFGLPTLGNTGFQLRVHANAPLAPVALVLAGGSGSAPLGGGCTLWVSMVSFVGTIPGQTDASGFATFPFPIPGNPSLVGLGLASQGIVVDPNGPFAGLSFTNGLRMTVGE